MQVLRWPVIVCMVAVGFVVLVSLHDELDQGWDVSSRIAGLDARVPGLGVLPEISSRDVELFFAQFWEKSPVIVRRATIDRNNNFREVVAKETLLQKFGDLPLLLSTANTASYQKKRVLLKDYVQHMMGAQDETVSGEDTLYQFGDQLSEISSLLLPLYELPGKEWMKHVNQTALSFGLSGTGAGVPFHTHGAVFAEVLVGRKRWFVSAPANKPEFSGVNTTLFWLRNVLPQIADKSIILDGICERGDLLYLPSFWWHSTLNIGQCVFMSVFI